MNQYFNKKPENIMRLLRCLQRTRILLYCKQLINSTLNNIDAYVTMKSFPFLHASISGMSEIGPYHVPGRIILNGP